MVTYGDEQVGLAETDAAVDEEWVVVGGRIVGDGLGCCMGKLVACTADEGLEGVFRVQVGGKLHLFMLFPGRRFIGGNGHCGRGGIFFPLDLFVDPEFDLELDAGEG